MRYKTPEFLLTVLLVLGGLFSLSTMVHASGMAMGQHVPSRFANLPHNLYSTADTSSDGRIINNPINKAPYRASYNYHDYITSPNPYYRKNQVKNNITPYSSHNNPYYNNSQQYHDDTITNNYQLSDGLDTLRISLERYIDECSAIDEDNTSSIVFDCLLGDNLPVFHDTPLDISPLANNLLFVIWIEHHTASFSSREDQEAGLSNLYDILIDVDEDTAAYYHINVEDLMTILEHVLDAF